MKNLFQIQTESGQLWLDIKAQLDAKDEEANTARRADAEEFRVELESAATKSAATITALTAERDTITTEFAAYREAAGKAATAIKAVISDPTKDDAATVTDIAQIVAFGESEANKTARERDLEAAQSQLAAAQARVKELSV